jgi:alpha-glucosidase (family GH31 glycosyl hydrolase)
MRPLWFEFPEAEALYGVQDQFMLGPALLAAPVLQEGAASRAVLLPQQATWFDAATGALGTHLIHRLTCVLLALW